MISDIAPFRKIIAQALTTPDAIFHSRERAAETLKYLNLSPIIDIELKSSRKTKNSDSQESEPQTKRSLKYDVHLDLKAGELNYELDRNLSDLVLSGSAELSVLGLERNGVGLTVNDLSSGERSYLLAGLGVCFCACPNTLILFDEPENSLHPAWQLTIMRSMRDTLNDLYNSSTFVVCTHSPLVASSITGEEVYIQNLPNDQTWRASDLNGKSSDAVLVEQFDLVSPRSPAALDAIQQCLTLIAIGKDDTVEFREAVDNLNRLNIDLTKNDPLYDAVTTIRSMGSMQN
jgi:hypothetical protein